MSNMEFLAKALSLHTKGKDASFLKESAIVEAKCDCCGDDPCSCPADCKCKVNEGTDLKHDKNHNGIDDKQEKEPKDNTVKKTEKMSEASPSDIASAGRSQPAKAGNAKAHALSKASDEAQPKSNVSLKKAPWEEETEHSEDTLTEAEEVALEILEKLGTVYDEAIHLQGLLEHLGYDLEDLFAIEEDADEEMQEGFANVSKAKRLIAQRKAAMMRRLRQGAKPAPKPAKPGMPRR